MDPTGWTLTDYAAAYGTGVTVATVIESTLALLRDAPPGLLIGEPLDTRARADVARLDGVDPSSLPLFGIPFVVKDNIDVEAAPTTAGCPGFAYTPAEDATVVALLRAAGAIVVGKTNLDQFATGLVGTRSPYGAPPNVLDPTLVPGGSSSGSAVAVALGLVPFSLGTDTAGSGRVPAALNGVVGLKPTLGRCSTLGIVPAVRRLDCPSVFASNVADASLVADVISAIEPRDPSMRAPQARGVFRDRPVVGVPAAWHGVGLSLEMSAWFDESLDRLVELGCDLVPVDIGPLVEIGAMLYGSSLVAERTAAVGDAVDKAVDGLDPVVATIIAAGNDISAVEAYRTEYELTRLRAAAASMWDAIDVLALPTTPSVATVDEVRADPFGSNESMGRLTTFVNLLDLMAVVVPVRTGIDRVPAGLQLIGQAWQDAEVERIAAGYESGVLTPATQPCTIVVVGAHLRGLPLHHQLTDRRASFVASTRTSADYRLYALAGTVPPKPGLIRVGRDGGSEIEVEVWSMGHAEFGSFVDAIPAPLAIGTVQLADGSTHNGFVCEPGWIDGGLDGATDITSFGGWRAYVSRR